MRRQFHSTTSTANIRENEVIKMHGCWLLLLQPCLLHLSNTIRRHTEVVLCIFFKFLSDDKELRHFADLFYLLSNRIDQNVCVEMLLGIFCAQHCN